MKCIAFCKRTVKELLRDPLTLIFGIGFPAVLMLLMSFLSRSIPEMSPQFGIKNFAPGMMVFGLSFLSLFLGQLIAHDRESSFLQRLFASPLSTWDYIIGYSLPLLPIALLQEIVCLILAVILGFPFSVHLIPMLIVCLFVSTLFISLGLLFGSLFTSTQIGGIGSILVNLCAWLSGTWLSLDLVGGEFRSICYLLPFSHAVDSVKFAAAGDLSSVLSHLIWLLGYSAVIFLIAGYLFRCKQQKG